MAGMPGFTVTLWRLVLMNKSLYSFTGNPLYPNHFKDQKQNSVGECVLEPKMTSDLAEVCGIHAGDGYLRNDGKRRELDISGGFEEKDYYDNHVVPLFEKVFKIKIKPRFFLHRNTYGFVIRNRSVIEFMHSLGFPYGKKTLTVAVPEQILESNDLRIIYRFVRGVFDTDGSLLFRKRSGSGYKRVHIVRHTQPSILLSVCSRNLCQGICELLTKTGYHFTLSYEKSRGNHNAKHKVELRGDLKIIRWMTNIGFKNPIKYNRFLIWKKHGFVPPSLCYEAQKKILLGNKDPNQYYLDDCPRDVDIVLSLVNKRLKFIQNFVGDNS